MTDSNAIALTYPRFEKDEAFWDDFFVVTHTWGHASGIESLSMEPEGYFAYSLERMGQDAQTYARTGCWPCVSCEELFPRESLDLNYRCDPCSQQRHQNERRFRERVQGLNLKWPRRSAYPCFGRNTTECIRPKGSQKAIFMTKFRQDLEKPAPLSQEDWLGILAGTIGMAAATVYFGLFFLSKVTWG